MTSLALFKFAWFTVEENMPKCVSNLSENFLKKFKVFGILLEPSL